MGMEKSAEAILGFTTKSEGPNLRTRDTVCDCEKEMEALKLDLRRFKLMCRKWAEPMVGI